MTKAIRLHLYIPTACIACEPWCHVIFFLHSWNTVKLMQRLVIS